MKLYFSKLAAKISAATGSANAFLIALSAVLIWALTGPLFGFSDTWQLVINTSTTIVTFLMVFLIQNTQNRDSKAMQLKLDELIRSTTARNAFVDLEDLSDEELAELDKEFQIIREKQSGGKVMTQMHVSIQLEHERRKGGVLSPAKINEFFHMHKKIK